MKRRYYPFVGRSFAEGGEAATPFDLRAQIEGGEAAAPAPMTVADLYASVLGRTADAPGAQYWSQQFGETVDPTELEAFRAAAAPELAKRQADPSAYLQDVQSANAALLNLQNAPSGLDPYGLLYQAYGGRAPDEAGRQYWQQQQGAVITPAEMQEFYRAIQPEIAASAPPSTQTFTGPMAEQIAGLYEEYLDRKPESQAAIDYWTSELGQDELSELDRQRFASVAQTEIEGRKGRVGPSVAEQLYNINQLIQAPQVGVADKRGDAAGETYALNQDALGLDKIRIQLRDAYDDPAKLAQIEQDIENAKFSDPNTKISARQYLDDARARIDGNKDVMTGDYINEYARSLDRTFGGLLTPNQANILARDYTPDEAKEAFNAYALSGGKMLPEDALRAARMYDEQDSANIAKTYRWSQSSQGQPGTLGGTLNFHHAITRYNPETNTFEGHGRKPEKDVFAAQFNAGLNVGERLPTSEGLNPVGDGFYTKRLGNPGAFDLYAVYATDPSTGDVVQVGTSTNFRPELSGFKKFISSPLGQLVLAGATALVAPGLGNALGSAFGSQVAGQVGAGALLGGARSALTGGNFFKGALAGGLGAGVGNYVGGLESLQGLNPELLKGIAQGAGNLASTAVMSDFDILSMLAAGAAPIAGGAMRGANITAGGLPLDPRLQNALGTGAATATDALIRSGGDINTALQIGAAQTVGSYIAPTFSGGLQPYLPTRLADVIGQGAGSAAASQIMGGNPAQAAIMGAGAAAVDPYINAIQNAANQAFGRAR
jgi:hypothetical protein